MIPYNINASDFDFEEITEVVSSTALTQDISTSYNPDIEVITAKDIKLYGVENLPDLLALISGVNIYRVNASTANVAIRGFPGWANIFPKIMIDGREIEDKFIMNTYLYNMSVSIDDIDRIEVVKGNSFYNDDLSSPSGLINIVTKSPELLEKNYVSAGTGSNSLKKLNFSIDKFLYNIYFKVTGEIRGINEYNKSKRADKTKFINVALTKFIGDNSLIYLKTSIFESDGDFADKFFLNFLGNPIIVPYITNVKNTIARNFFICYKYPLMEISFLYNYNRSNVYTHVMGEDISGEIGKSEFYKINLKKKFSFDSHNFTIGLVNKTYTLSFGKGNRKKNNFFTFYLKDNFDLSDFITLKGSLKNDTITDYGNNFTYFFYGSLHSKDKSYGISLDYSKSFKLPKGLYKFINLHTEISDSVKNLLPFHVKSVDTIANKDLKPVKSYSTNFKIFYNKNGFNFKTTFFYNRITDFVTDNAYVDVSNIASLKMILHGVNMTNMIIHGFETDAEYKVSKLLKVFSSYFLQHLKIKSPFLTAQEDFFIPRSKVTFGGLFNTRVISGSLFAYYMPQIHYLENSSDDYFNVDLYVMKNFFKDKLEISLNIKNILNNVHRETGLGENLKRSYFFKVKYYF